MTEATAADIAFHSSLQPLFDSVTHLEISIANHSEFRASHAISGLITRFSNLTSLKLRGLLTATACEQLTTISKLDKIDLETAPFHSHVHDAADDVHYIVRDMLRILSSKLAAFSYPHISYFDLPVVSPVEVCTLRSLQLSVGGAHADHLSEMITRNRGLEQLKLLLYLNPLSDALFGTGWATVANAIANHESLKCIAFDDGNAGYTFAQSCDGDMFDFVNVSEQAHIVSAMRTILSSVGSRLKAFEFRIVMSEASLDAIAPAANDIFKAVSDHCENIEELVVHMRVRVQCARWAWRWGDVENVREWAKKLSESKENVTRNCTKLFKFDDGDLVKDTMNAADDLEAEAENCLADVFDESIEL